ncbi:Similar to hypothetical protein TRIATDRAFT_285335 [Trichoderma atroviride IMI 206040]; acc. no. EHK42578 [Pyronema omphalodes CBS 100304]|uniref:DUF676 domain-containing protein n=1 Tax=Pyronema omphalodes (strain CBS 100304) TaxID=1076935 RepID=U4KWI9_PYROM|nr:Similar to hypothetical protein TRIATDRAFT_285335 [Trichoderma atroviride IMI 206040]; acc. no. EHK42578 [Pyronema omphalodes CBS 100304]
MTALHNSGNNALVDIVAITGLAGHAFGSWRAQKEDTMWLRDLLPFDIDVPSRIFIYGCDSPVEKSDNNSSVLDYARELLNGVSSSLQSEETKWRPLIFLAHSLRGLISKQRKSDLGQTKPYYYATSASSYMAYRVVV